MHTPSPALTPAEAVAPTALHAAFGVAFADYLIPGLSVSADAWPDFLARQGVALADSRAVLDAAGAVAAFVFIAPRPALGRWRIATVGARPDARGSGAARALITDALQRARAHGLRGVELEVFAQNARARALYERLGFVAEAELHGWRGQPGPAADAAAVRRVSVDDAHAWLRAAEQRHEPLPMQMAPLALAGPPADLRIWRSRDDTAQLVVADAGGAPRVRSLIAPGAAHSPHATDLLAAVGSTGPLTIPALLRPELGGHALHHAGWQRESLHQLWMHHPLTEPETAP